jgi:hypothetical protein
VTILHIQGDTSVINAESTLTAADKDDAEQFSF